MNGIYLTAEELDALHGAGPLATTLYLYMRSWMDIRTGEVGVTRPISLAMLATYGETHTARHTGEQVEHPTQKNVRTALDRLGRRGLLQRRRTERLVFLLPMSRTGKVRPNNTRHSEGTTLSTEPGTVADGKSRSVVGFAGRDESIPGTAKDHADGLYPAHIGDQSKPSTSQSSSHPESKVRARRPGDDEKTRSAERDEAQPPCPDSARVNAVAALLRMQGVAVGYESAVLVRWVDAGVGDEDIAIAVGRARAARAKAGSEQPIGIRYLDKVVRTVRAEAAREQREAWRGSEQTMVAKGRELGMAPAPGETWAAFARRIEARLLEIDRQRLHGGGA